MNQFAVESLNHLQVGAHLVDAQQNLDEQILDEHQTFLDVDHFREHRLDVVVDVEHCHQLKMDYFLDAQLAALELHLVAQALLVLVVVVEFVALRSVQGAPLFLLAPP